MKDIKEYRILLVGNPNCGKTTVFNSLCKERAKVGNYSGVTVDRKIGFFSVGNLKVMVEDLPGVYTLSSSTAEEKITRDTIANGGYDLIVNVVDSSNFERNMFLTLQLMELQSPMIIALNMSDELEKEGKYIDISGLSTALGVPITQCVGHSDISINSLRKFIACHLESCTISHFLWDYLPDNLLTQKINSLSAILRKGLPPAFASFSKWMALRAIENDSFVLDSLKAKTPHLYQAVLLTMADIKESTDETSQALVSAARYGLVKKVALPFLKTRKSFSSNFTCKLDSIFLNRFIGIPIFFILMYAIFEFVFALGAPFMTMLEKFFATLADATSSLWSSGTNSILKDFIVNGLIGGVGGVFVFLPNIILLFLALSILEDSGYMARAAFLCDRVMKRFGLSGASIIPMLVGFGCSVPAIIGTRTLKSRTERIATLMVIPLFSCGARFPVYMLLIPAFFAQEYCSTVMFGLYIFGIITALILAKILRLSVLRGGDSSFLIELPPYRLPRFRNMYNQVSFRSWDFIKKAGTIILAMSILLWVLSSFPRQNPNEENSSSGFEQTYMGKIGGAIEPVFKPLGFDSKIVSSLIGSLAAKEVFISQLNIVYGLENNEEEFGSTALRSRLAVDYTPVQGLAILFFILLSAPCMATVSTSYAETHSIKIAAAQFFTLTFIAYIVSFAVYQLGTYFI